MNDKFKNDKLKFELSNVSKCEMYEEKPSTVIDGGNCDLYDKGVSE